MSTIHLREIERADLGRINAWRNDAEVIRLLGANFFYINPQIDDRWFDGYLANRDKAVRLAIVETESNTHIGNVYLTGIHAVNRSAEFSIMLGDKRFWSRGYGRPATEEMLRHAFEDLNLHRVYLTLLQDNERARRLYERVGFQVEGVQREAVFKDGRYHDVLEMALLRPDYLAQKAATAAAGTV